MTREEVRQIVIELLQELTEGLVKSDPVVDEDGDEWNNDTFDGEEFVNRIFRNRVM